MKKIGLLLLTLCLCLGIISPSVIAQTEAEPLTIDNALHTVVDNMRNLQSFSGTYELTAKVTGEEPNRSINAQGDMAIVVHPRPELTFNLTADTDHLVEAELPDHIHAELMAFIADNYIGFKVDSPQFNMYDALGQWHIMTEEQFDYDLDQFTLEMYQDIHRTFMNFLDEKYFPSEAQQLLLDQSTFTETDNGYQAVVKSFDTQEEWLAFFHAAYDLAEESEEALDTEITDNVAPTPEEREAEMQEVARILSEDLDFTITYDITKDHFLEGLVIDLQLDPIQLYELNEVVDIPQHQLFELDFSFRSDALNTINDIEIPEEARPFLNSTSNP